jgi:asparagine synthase (glutamine-hydrolysing)
MSGVAGIVDFGGRPVDPMEIENMLDIMDYRAVDGRGTWDGATVVLGHCMTHTTPESREATLPLSNADGSLCVVLDGRIDNWEDLRSLLLGRGMQLRTRSDAELVLAAYELWGEECVKSFDGSFAIAIWDARRRRLFCARDIIGFKPFFFHWSGTRFYFASDASSLLRHPEIPAEIDEAIVAQIILDDLIYTEQTIWAAVRRLPPRSMAVVAEYGPRITHYWEPDLATVLRYRKQEDYVDHYRELLFDEVRRASRSIGPLACSVSGGLDSSALFAVADALEKEGKFLADGLKGYTLLFEESFAGYELPYARATAVHLKRSIEEVPAARPDLEWYEAFASQHLTLPPWPNGTSSKRILERAHADGCRVYMDGIGGDEWLTGSVFAPADAIARDPRVIPSYLRSFSGSRGAFEVATELIRFGAYPFIPLRARQILRQVTGRRANDDFAYQVLSPRLLQLHKSNKRDNAIPTLSRGSQFQREYFDTLDDVFLIMAKEITELTTALAGLERRSPLSSKRMLQFCFSVPQARRLWGGTNKAIHRSALQCYLPVTVLQRRSKARFNDLLTERVSQLRARPGWKSEAMLKGWAEASGLEHLDAGLQATPSPFAVQRTAWSIFSCAALKLRVT